MDGRRGLAASGGALAIAPLTIRAAPISPGFLQRIEEGRVIGVLTARPVARPAAWHPWTRAVEGARRLFRDRRRRLC
ncbi:hypothetical protein CHELA41_23458 [Hyphomicrobiales bacterium]|nr:hypothetical protein CHELA41_23458 [Hyphomicrobiales bacterium]